MKILCTTDFSLASINAIKWTLAYLESIGGGEVEIIHCLDIRSRGDMFLDVEALMREPAEEDMKTLLAKLSYHKGNISLDTKIVSANPKSYIPKRAKKIGADLIAIGTTGLTNLKNLTIGSVTEYLVRHTKLPVISIPKSANFKNFNKIVLGVDEKLMKRPQSLEGLKKFISRKRVKLFIAQVYKENKSFIKLDDKIFDTFEGYNTEVKPVEFNDSISTSLNDFADDVNAQIMCIIHHKRNWFSRLFHHSILKEELFNQELPILFIPD